MAKIVLNRVVPNKVGDKERKDAALAALMSDRAKGLEHGTYSIASVRAIRDMAANDTWPDGRFGDLDCNLWSMLREAYY